MSKLRQRMIEDPKARAEAVAEAMGKIRGADILKVLGGTQSKMLQDFMK